ncbi:MAG: AMIN domain-containing protein [Candidatus Eiseniibacteriota bacterium]|nr:MAG: AMIN domain-containing protein [Candidatus Eisenbacteria bacterium]
MQSRLKGGFLVLIACALLLYAAPLGSSQVCQVQKVEVTDRGSVTEIAISASAPLSYRDFTLSDPPRIVVDCLDALHALSAPLGEMPGNTVVGIRTSQWKEDPDRNITRVVIDLVSESSYSVSSTNGGLVVVIGGSTAGTEAGSVPSGKPSRADLPPGAGELVSLDVQGADINTVIRTLSEFSGRNIVANRQVKGPVTVRLKSVPWRSALEIILTTQGLSYVEEEGIIRVATADELREEEIAKQTAERKKEDLLPLEVRRVKINFANASELKQSLDKLLTRRGSIEVDQRTNSLIITDISSKIDAVQGLARELDSMTPQVEITAKMVDIDVSVSRELGIVWDATGLDIGKQGVDEDLSVNAPVLDPVGTVRIGAVRDYGSLSATLQALETENKADIISNPRITTVNNREASILVGKEIPLIVQDEAGNPVTEMKKVGITLRVTPHINSETEITLDLHPEVSDLASQATVQGGVIINTTEADTRVIVRDGETAVIGGLIRENITSVKRGVPILQSIPLLGYLFRSTSDTKSKRELLIFITPKIVQATALSSAE